MEIKVELGKVKTTSKVFAASVALGVWLVAFAVDVLIVWVFYSRVMGAFNGVPLSIWDAVGALLVINIVGNYFHGMSPVLMNIVSLTEKSDEDCDAEPVGK